MRRRPTMHLLSRLLHDREGVAAIEFALVALPLFILIFGILELGAIFFIDSALDASVHKSARLIRTGQATEGKMGISGFKAEICSNLAYVLNCEKNLLVAVNTVTDATSSGAMKTIGNSGTVTITENFDIGRGSDYVLVQAFLPWSPIVNLYALSSHTLADGSYLLGASALLRNEPF
ncbi:TadE/TadG family type IV pilus assembly protein [Sinorhizobium alkalisoli]|uniref:Pilus assembly protein TadG n=1 Tax=Sinorhizobium alkalisoli TaxID=1752398 RepID=A0A1E3V7G1_9HYPH|nr:TadE/TadG family type IV pilus assembly protein [Sinorhizobium alkalisoli]MCA1491279.1 pilus assembly protein [Ensifer sp. NBAIM29]MCG5480085.1 pilus assembly protein [Sinorhizobium alkalisoli]ODR88756.1 pilus assembly protein TadG [Sinorhizobium alkalisoli]